MLVLTAITFLTLDLRGFGPLTSLHTKNSDEGQVLVLIRPRLITLPPGIANSHTFRMGSDNRPITPL